MINRLKNKLRIWFLRKIAGGQMIIINAKIVTYGPIAYVEKPALELSFGWCVDCEFKQNIDDINHVSITPANAL